MWVSVSIEREYHCWHALGRGDARSNVGWKAWQDLARAGINPFPQTLVIISIKQPVSPSSASRHHGVLSPSPPSICSLASPQCRASVFHMQISRGCFSCLVSYTAPVTCGIELEMTSRQAGAHYLDKLSLRKLPWAWIIKITRNISLSCAEMILIVHFSEILSVSWIGPFTSVACKFLRSHGGSPAAAPGTHLF